MGDDKTASEFPSQQQRYLVCARQWEADRSAFADTYADYGEGVRNNAKRGIELNETQKQRLEAMEKSITLLAAMIDWKEEPCQVFRVQEDPQ